MEPTTLPSDREVSWPRGDEPAEGFRYRLHLTAMRRSERDSGMPCDSWMPRYS